MLQVLSLLATGSANEHARLVLALMVDDQSVPPGG